MAMKLKPPVIVLNTTAKKLATVPSTAVKLGTVKEHDLTVKQSSAATAKLTSSESYVSGMSTGSIHDSKLPISNLIQKFRCV